MRLSDGVVDLLEILEQHGQLESRQLGEGVRRGDRGEARVELHVLHDRAVLAQPERVGQSRALALEDPTPERNAEREAVEFPRRQ